jgi:hypothetical protein
LTCRTDVAGLSERGQLGHALTGQLVSDARYLTVDPSGLAFADSDSILNP